MGCGFRMKFRRSILQKNIKNNKLVEQYITTGPFCPMFLNMEPTVNSPPAKFNRIDPAANWLEVKHRIRKIFTDSEQEDNKGNPDAGIIVATGFDFPLKYSAGRETVM